MEEPRHSRSNPDPDLNDSVTTSKLGCIGPVSIDHDTAKSYVSKFINIHRSNFSTRNHCDKGSVPSSRDTGGAGSKFTRDRDLRGTGGSSGTIFRSLHHLDRRHATYPIIYYSASVDLSPQRAYHCTGAGEACHFSNYPLTKNFGGCAPYDSYRDDYHHRSYVRQEPEPDHVPTPTKNYCGAVHYGFCSPLNPNASAPQSPNLCSPYPHPSPPQTFFRAGTYFRGEKGGGRGVGDKENLARRVSAATYTEFECQERNDTLLHALGGDVGVVDPDDDSEERYLNHVIGNGIHAYASTPFVRQYRRAHFKARRRGYMENSGSSSDGRSSSPPSRSVGGSHTTIITATTQPSVSSPQNHTIVTGTPSVTSRLRRSNSASRSPSPAMGRDVSTGVVARVKDQYAWRSRSPADSAATDTGTGHKPDAASAQKSLLRSHSFKERSGNVVDGRRSRSSFAPPDIDKGVGGGRATSPLTEAAPVSNAKLHKHPSNTNIPSARTSGTAPEMVTKPSSQGASSVNYPRTTHPTNHDRRGIFKKCSEDHLTSVPSPPSHLNPPSNSLTTTNSNHMSGSANRPDGHTQRPSGPSPSLPSLSRSILQKRAFFEKVHELPRYLGTGVGSLGDLSPGSGRPHFTSASHFYPRSAPSPLPDESPSVGGINPKRAVAFPHKFHSAHQYRSKLFYENLSAPPNHKSAAADSPAWCDTIPVPSPKVTPPAKPERVANKAAEAGEGTGAQPPTRPTKSATSAAAAPTVPCSTVTYKTVVTEPCSNSPATAKAKTSTLQAANPPSSRFSLLGSNKIFQSQPTVTKKKRGSITDAELSREAIQQASAFQRTLSLPRKKAVSIRPSKDIPKFHFPYGKPAQPLPRHLENTAKALTRIKEIFSKVPGQKITQVDETFVKIIKICEFPLYWKKPLFLASSETGCVTYESYSKFWKRLVDSYHDEVSKFYHILARPDSRGLTVEDFIPMMNDIIETHPGLSFLKEVKEFHMRYVHTVISRIFFVINRSWSGVITLPELKKYPKIMETVRMLETEEDINKVTDFFSYEHFYVIYCKFWELDTDHDLLIDKKDLSRHGDFALSSRIVDRIFSGAVTRGPIRKDHKMTYQEFVWFLIAEEDKKQPTSIEYWFRCMDIDGDGILSLYELEYFYEEQAKRLESLGMEPLPFKDCLCQILDIIRPHDPKKIKLGDLKNSKMTAMFFDTFFNVDKYLDFEQKDPFLLMRPEKEELNPISDWDRYVTYEYENLVAEENYTGPYDEDDNLTSGPDDEDVTDGKLRKILSPQESAKESPSKNNTSSSQGKDSTVVSETSKKSASSFIDEVKLKFKK